MKESSKVLLIQTLGEWRRSADTGWGSTKDVQMVTGLANAV